MKKELDYIKTITIKEIKDYLQEKHELKTQARKIKYYNNGEFLQLGNILIQFDLYANKEYLKEKSSSTDDSTAKKAQIEMKLFEKFNLNGVAVVAIYEEKNKPRLDNFAGKVQAPQLFDYTEEFFKLVREYHQKAS